MYKRILVPMDGSPTAEQALPHVRELATRFEAEITLVNVLTPFLRLVATVGAENAQMAADAERKEAEDYMESMRKQLAGEGFKVRALIAEGVAGEVIVAQAKEDAADVIVMCTHGRTGLGRLVLGSVADHVVRHAGAPVLLVRAQKE